MIAGNWRKCSIDCAEQSDNAISYSAGPAQRAGRWGPGNAGVKRPWGVAEFAFSEFPA